MLLIVLIEPVAEFTIVAKPLERLHAVAIQPITLTHSNCALSLPEYGRDALYNCQHLIPVLLVYGQRVHLERAVAHKTQQVVSDKVRLLLGRLHLIGDAGDYMLFHLTLDVGEGDVVDLVGMCSEDLELSIYIACKLDERLSGVICSLIFSTTRASGYCICLHPKAKALEGV